MNKKSVSIIMVIMMLMTYLAPVSKVLAEEPIFKVDLKEPVHTEGGVELNYTVAYDRSLGEIELVELVKNGVAHPIKAVPDKLSPDSKNEQVRIEYYTYLDPIGKETEEMTYSVKVTLGSAVSESNQTSLKEAWENLETPLSEEEVKEENESSDEQSSAESNEKDVEGEVVFVNSNLEHVVRKELGIDEGPLTNLDLMNLTKLVAADQEISDLTGLESAINLASLDLSNNPISDLTPVYSLPALKFLKLSGTDVDLSSSEVKEKLRVLREKGVKVQTEDESLSTSNPVTINKEANNKESLNVETDKPVTIEDSRLENAIKGELGIQGRDLFESDMLTITSLYLEEKGITSLKGLETAVNLEFIDLRSNSVTDLSPLQNLTKLTSLDLYSNGIEDIHPLAALTNLENLTLWNNNISDISALGGLTKLTDLDLDTNQISDLKPLENLVNLDWLYLANNPASDLEPLRKLVNLSELYLYDMPLDLTDGSSAMQVISYLRELGVTVEYDYSEEYDQVYLEVSDVTATSAAFHWGSDFDTAQVESATLVLTENGNLEEPIVHEFKVDYQSMEHVVEGLKPLTDYDAYLDIRLYTGEEYSGWTDFRTESDRPEEEVLFEDENLELAVRNQLGIYEGKVFTTDLADLTYLDASNMNIESLTGLEEAYNLNVLYLDSNHISDIQPLENLQELMTLSLSYNPITDGSVLAQLQLLNEVDISGTDIFDLSFLANLPSLYWVGAYDIAIDYTTDESARNIIKALQEKGVGVYYFDEGWFDEFNFSSYENEIYIEWNFVEGSFGPPSSYQILLDGSPVTEVEDLSYTITGLVPNKEYSLEIYPNYNGLRGEGIYEEIRTSAEISGELVQIEDPGLEAAIKKQLGLSHRDLYESDMLLLMYLNADSNQIESLEGIQYAANLTSLNVSFNRISDIGPLSDLTSLTSLSLWDNEINDISPLAKLINLSDLDLEANQVTDLSPLENLMKLDWLYLTGNPASDLEPLRNLTQLSYLNLYDMPIDLTEGSAAMDVIYYLVEKGVEVEYGEYYYNEIYLEASNVTDTAATINWYTDLNLGSIESATLEVIDYSMGEPNLQEYEVDFESGEYVLEGLSPFTDYEVYLHVISSTGEEYSSYTGFTTFTDTPGEKVVFEDEGLEQAIKRELGIQHRDLLKTDLEELYYLDGSGLGITSLQGLEQAVNLQTLYLSSNNFHDIQPLETLKNLNYLDLSDNLIASVDILGELQQLTTVNIGYTEVSDLSFLSNLPELEWVGVNDIAIDYSSDEAAMAIIYELQARGVEVYYLDYGWFDYYDYSTTENEIFLEWLFVEGDMGTPTSYRIYLDGEEVANVHDSTYTISNLTPDTEYDIEIVADYGGTLNESVFFKVRTYGEPEGEIVNIDDSGLSAAIKSELGIEDREIYESDLLNLTYLTANHSNIESLEGLQYAVNLVSLDLNFNMISDLGPISELTSLNYLYLWGNNIKDISPLKGLTSIIDLDLDSNQIEDLSPLDNLVNLDWLYLRANPATDIEVLRGLTNLTYVNLEDMPIDLTEGSAALQTINYLRDNGVDVQLSVDYEEGLWMDTSEVTDTTATISWYGTIVNEMVDSASIQVYDYSINGNPLVTEEEVDFSLGVHTIEGLIANTEYEMILTVNLLNGNSQTVYHSFQTTWPEGSVVEDVSFKVVNQNGEAVPNMEVSFEGAEVFLYGYTDQSGMFHSWYEQGTSFELPEGEYSAFIYGGKKYGDLVKEITISKDGTYPLRIMVEELNVDTTDVSIHVKDQEGNPVTSLDYVSLYSWETVNGFGYDYGAYTQWDLKSDDGVYTLTDLAVADDYVLNIESGDYKIWSQSDMSISEGASVSVVLDKGAEVKASVLTSDGQPMTGASYSIYGAESYAYGSIEKAGIIDAGGLNEEDLTIEIWMPGYLTYTAPISASQFVEGVADIGEVTLQPEQFIDGYVYKSKADEPVKNAYVNLYGEGDSWSSYWARTDANGYFKIRNVKPGTYLLETEAYNLPNSKIEAVEAGSTVEVFLVQDTSGAFTGEGNSFGTSKTNAIPGETIEYRLNYKNNSGVDAQDVRVNFTLPSSAEIITESLLMPTSAVNTSLFAAEKSLILNEVGAGEEGTISFKVKVKDGAVENLTSSATIHSGEEEINLHSTVSLTFVTLNSPVVTSTSKVKVYGSAKPGSTVKVYAGNILLVETTVPINSRWWYADVQLPVREGETSKHQLVAKVTGQNGTASSKPIEIQYDPAVPSISDVQISAGWNQDVSLNPYTGVASMAIVEFTPITLKAKFDHEVDKATLHFLGEEYSLTRNGDYYEALIPGTWSSYGEQLMELSFEKDGQIIKVPLLEVIVLIDPSGYVFEGSMDNRIEGVTAVVEEKQEDGRWKPWNAAAFAQVNPQVTDEDGRYGWDVIHGTWHVIFSKEGYRTYTSRDVYVPPAETELNVPLVRTTKPIVKEASIEDGEENVSENPTISITFDRLMDESTMHNIVVLDQEGNEVDGEVSGIEHLFGYKEIEKSPGYFEEDQSKLLSKTFEWSPSENLAGGTYQLVVNKEMVDYDGKVLEDAHHISFTVGVEDFTAPETPVVDEVTDQSTKVTGTAESGSTVKIKVDGSEIGNGKATENGSYTVEIPQQPAGTEVTVTATDAAGNESKGTVVVVKDVTAPEAPVVNEVTNQSAEVTGTAESGSTVKIKVDGSEIGNGKATENGSYTVEIPQQPAGTEVTVTAIDAAGNESKGTVVVVKDVTAPEAPVVNEVTDQSTEVTGTAESGTIVKVKVDGSEIGSGKASETGSYTVEISQQPAGTEVTVTATDAAGNESKAAVVIVNSLYVGWVKSENKWYYYDEDSGKVVQQWLSYKNDWYYLGQDGVMQTGWLHSEGKWYYLANSGIMKTGWVKSGSKWYHLTASGAMETGWIKSGSKWYYLDNSGAMKTSWIKSGGKWYYLESSGAMSTGWIKLSGSWYYLANSGIMITGWKKVGSEWYYFYSSGKMAFNTTIGGYKLGSNGNLIN
ncbi:hypothetical protein A6P54_12635 [Bacillus sp. MKU004]|nr:hypothetical protein A6P54_12635 [Bacillus sp. MKU004]